MLRPDPIKGAFAGGIGLRIRRDKATKRLSAQAGFVVKRLADDPRGFDDGKQVQNDIDPEHVLDVGKRLAEVVADRSTLLKAFDRTPFTVPETPKGNDGPGNGGSGGGAGGGDPTKLTKLAAPPPPSAAWALLSAGAPLIGDGNRTQHWLGVGLSAVDAAALVGAAGFFISAKMSRDDYASGSATSLDSADTQYGRAIGLLITAGIAKGVGFVISLVAHRGAGEAAQ